MLATFRRAKAMSRASWCVQHHRRQCRKRAGNREDILYFLQNHPAIEWAKALKGKSSDTCKLAEKDKRRSAGPESKERGLGVIKLSAIAFRQQTPPRIWE